MIGRLKGIIDKIGDAYVLLDVGGVGYKIEASQKMLAQMPPSGEVVALEIETYVREDQLRLFGFLNEEERRWFCLLMGVQGVGAKAALNIQSILSAQELGLAISAQDKEMIKRASGIGEKVALRIIQELKDKVPEISAPATQTHKGSEHINDAMSALVNLGYHRSAVYPYLIKAHHQLGDKGDVRALISETLKHLGRSG